jgi:spore germination protein (amino acid permease)
VDLGKLTQKQMIVLSVFFIFGTMFISLPRILSDTAQHTGWLCIAIATVFFAAYSYLLHKVILLIDKMDFIGFVHSLTGRWAGPPFTLLFLLLPMLLYSAYVSRLVIELFVTLILPETPFEVLIAMVLILRYWMVSGGIRAIGLFAELIFPIVAVVLILMLIMSSAEADHTRIMPYYDADAAGLYKGTMTVLSTYLEVGVMLFIANRLREAKRTAASMLLVNISVGILFVAVYWLCLGNFGTAYTKRLAFPTIEMIRNISIGQFIEHMESVFLAMWLMINMAKGSLTMYACCVGFQSWFRLPSYKPLMLPLSVIIYFLALLPQNLLQAVFRFEQFKAATYPYYGFGMILFLLLFAKFKSTERSKNG